MKYAPGHLQRCPPGRDALHTPQPKSGRRPNSALASLLISFVLAACGPQTPQSENNLLGAGTSIGSDNNSVGQPAQVSNPNSNPLSSVSVMAPSAAVLSALGGAVIALPRVQLVTFNADSEAASVQNFLLAWAASGAWEQMTHEYGIGPLAVAPLVRSTLDWAPTVSDGVISGNANTDIESAIIANLDAAPGTAAAWGTADANTVYVLEMPNNVAVAPTPGAPSACDANTLAWHGAVTLPRSQIIVPYIVVPTCQPAQALSQVDSKTYALSHTLIGAVTDPTGQGFAAIDAAHAVWQLVSQSPEASDLCNQAMYNSSHVLMRRADVPQALARTWSNVEARLGHAPCVPAIDGEVFFAAAAAVQDAVEVALGPNADVASATTVGLSLGAGAQRTVSIVLTSYPTNAGAFNVVVQEVGSKDLTLTLPVRSGSHGQTLSLGVAVAAAPNTKQQVVRVTASQGDASFSQYFLVRQPDADED